MEIGVFLFATERPKVLLPTLLVLVAATVLVVLNSGMPGVGGTGG